LLRFSSLSFSTSSLFFHSSVIFLCLTLRSWTTFMRPSQFFAKSNKK
jgi:hypothetical protein